MFDWLNDAVDWVSDNVGDISNVFDDLGNILGTNSGSSPTGNAGNNDTTKTYKLPEKKQDDTLLYIAGGVVLYLLLKK